MSAFFVIQKYYIFLHYSDVPVPVRTKQKINNKKRFPGQELLFYTLTSLFLIVVKLDFRVGGGNAR
jgi:hypothetical protein